MNLRRECRRYLEGLQATLWGQAFNIKDENLDEAVEWLNEQVDAVAGPDIDRVYEDYAELLQRWKEEQRMRIDAEGKWARHMLIEGSQPPLLPAGRVAEYVSDLFRRLKTAEVEWKHWMERALAAEEARRDQ